ncbi:hypothetical protein M2347_000088 [Chryseobacterium sp. H1D6B]|nr:hypothetical protein [Chryseobacterium sp. H1D6B]
MNLPLQQRLYLVISVLFYTIPNIQLLFGTNHVTNKDFSSTTENFWDEFQANSYGWVA